MTAEKKIAGKTFRVKQPLATEALRLQFRVMNIVAGSGDDVSKVFAALGAMRSDASSAAANASVIGAVIGILGRMKPDEGTQLVSDLVAMAEIKAGSGKYETADIDTEFSSDPSGLYELVGFVLREVLGPFISGLVGSMSQPKSSEA